MPDSGDQLVEVCQEERDMVQNDQNDQKDQDDAPFQVDDLVGLLVLNQAQRQQQKHEAQRQGNLDQVGEIGSVLCEEIQTALRPPGQPESIGFVIGLASAAHAYLIGLVH